MAHFGPVKVAAEGPDERYPFLSDVLPTAWQAAVYADVPGVLAELVDGRGPDAVVDAVGMEAHGSPAAATAHRLTAMVTRRRAARPRRSPPG
jgi:hypothetical protein